MDDRSDDIIRDSELYDYICRILDTLMSDSREIALSTLHDCIAEVTAEYDEKISGARKRLTNALEIIIIAYYASIIKSHSDRRIDELMNK